MVEKWFWLPDFASDMAIWEDDLEGIAPDADHSFISYEGMVPYMDHLFDMPGIADASVVVGWGLGAFLMLKNAEKRPKGQEWKLLSPYADYCSEQGNWTPENLSFIANQTVTAVDATLNALYEPIENEFGDWQDDWLKKAKSMSPDLMFQGLKYMAHNRIESPISGLDNVLVLYGKLDQAISPAMTLELKELLPGVVFKERPKAGHWPPMLLF